MTDGNEPAMPVANDEVYSSHGLTKREDFAKAAMAAIAVGCVVCDAMVAKEITQASVLLADQLIAALNRKDGGK